MEHWLFSWFHSANAVSTPALVREGRGRGGWAGWARCWVLREQTLFGSVLLDWTGFSPNGPGRTLLSVRAGVRGGLEAGTARTLRTA